MSTGLRGLTFLAALGTGTAAGVFFAFSSVVMPALARLPPAQAIRAMQSINVTAVRPVFMAVLFGTAAACVPLIVIAVRTRGDRTATLLLVGAVLYLVGTIALTIAYHVPRNERLALLDPDAVEAARQWSSYLTQWTRANHLRGAAALLASAAFIATLMP